METFESWPQAFATVGIAWAIAAIIIAAIKKFGE